VRKDSIPCIERTKYEIFIQEAFFMKKLFILGWVFVLLVSSCANVDKSIKPAAVPEIQPGILTGYLTRDTIPDSLALLAAPPATGSAAFVLDEEVKQKYLTLRDTPRWTLAVSDDDLTFPHAAGTFSCAIDAPITERNTPHLYILLRRVLTDAGLSTYKAKYYHKRTRPFVANKERTCTPSTEEHLAKNFSYPSGHTSIGWAWALILCEIAPDKTDAILARGRAFAESRLVCNVHWQSDLISGFLIGSAAVARLHADPIFRADLEAARAELAAVRKQGIKPTRDCEAEAGALSP
jgi:acid phosphatase (class A)